MTYGGDTKLRGNEAWTYLKSEGKGFTIGDVVTVTVDIDIGSIVWNVNGVNQASYDSKILRDSLIKWVPYVKVFNTGDTL